MSWAVVLWSSGLSALAGLNLLLWARAAVQLKGLLPTLPADVLSTRRLQLWLSAAYVLGCAFRSVIPVYDIPRIALIDSPLASVLVGRSVATVAELCFVAQWALTLREASRMTGSVFGRVSSALVLPMIFTAELCSWYSVLTTSNLGHVFEESLWALSATLMAASLLAAWSRWQPRHRLAVILLSAMAIGYVLYMILVDIPLYAGRWLASEASAAQYLTFAQGLRDIAHPHLVTYAHDIWRHEFIWMSLYFGVGVWSSVALIHSPLPERAPVTVSSGIAPLWLRQILRQRVFRI